VSWEDDLVPPEVPIRKVSRRVDWDQVDRLARRLAELAEAAGVRGPADLMREMERNRELRRHLRIQDAVVKRAREILKGDDQEEETVATEAEEIEVPVKKKTKAQRIREFIEGHLERHPDDGSQEVYGALPDDLAGMKFSSFVTSYWSGRGELWDAARLRGRETTPTADGSVAEPSPPDVPATGEIEDPWEGPDPELEEVERSEAGPASSPGPAVNGRGRVEMGQEGGTRLVLEPTAGGTWRAELVLECVDAHEAGVLIEKVWGELATAGQDAA
jgi:hypothetical protein